MDTSHPLFGAELRVDRADRYLTEASELITAFADDCAQYIVVDGDLETGECTISLSHTPTLPIHLPLAVSDCVHNLRAALDYLVYELARHDSGEFQDGTQFIVEDVKFDAHNPKRGFDARAKVYLKGISDDHVRRLEEFQPYMGCKWTKTLVQISNPDKHRQLTPIKDLGGRTIQMELGAIASPRKDGKRLPTGQTLHLDPRQAIRIQLPHGNVAVLVTLYDLKTAVTETIGSFKSEFRT
jgi:hypothetical protein